jgi:hypothetical protein
LEYRFEEAQKLRFAVYDLDNETASLADDDFLGSLECSLGEVRSCHICVCMNLNADPLTFAIIPIPKISVFAQAEKIWVPGGEAKHLSLNLHVNLV